MRTLALAVPFFLAALPAQSLLHSNALPLGHSCQSLRPAGDTNGDGELDAAMVVRQSLPNGWLLSVVIVSGATGATLHMLTDPVLQADRDIVGIGDVNNDGRSDVLLVTESLLRVYSGATGQVLTSLPAAASSRFVAACGVGDHNGNGTADAVIAIFDLGPSITTLRVVRGENLSLITNLATYPGEQITTMRAVGDLSGDGKTEVAHCRSSSATDVLNGSSGAVVWSLSPVGSDVGRRIDALDLDGDGKQEVFLFRPVFSGPGFSGTFSVHDAVTGAQRFARQGPFGGAYGMFVAGLGDLDQDGRQDFAQELEANGATTLLACSGVDGRRLWALSNWAPSQPFGSWVAALGDVDADTFGDFAVHRNGSASHGWHIISGKVLAESQPQAGACGGGPFFPQLGTTRPILGQTLTIAGLNGPPGVPGLLVFSLQPPAPTWLGASSCYAYFDLGSGVALVPITTPQWSLPIPLPLVPQFAGIEIALQAFYSPTSGPLGYDLSNGVWARLGYQ